jgi:hypothetical protein
MCFELRSASRSLLCLATITASTQATTYIVDAAGGGNFTDIPQAIAAAQPGDILLVQPGSYSPFVLDKGLVIVGYGSPTVNGLASLQNIPAPERTALVGLAPQWLDVGNCSGSVVVQSLGTLSSVAVHGCADVRAFDLQVVAPAMSGAPALTVDSSRFELVSSQARAGTGNPFTPIPGGRGLVLQSSSRAQSVASTIYGGDGGIFFQFGVYAVDGGHGGVVDVSSELVSVGPGARFQGGYGGANGWYSACDHNGVSGDGLLMDGSLFDSGTIFFGPSYSTDIHCLALPGTPIGGSGVHTPLVPQGPALELVSGTPAPGAPITIEIDAEPGATATLRLARIAGLTVTSGVLIEDLLGPSRVIPLGTMPASGVLTKNLVVPASLTSGRTLFLQIDVQGSGGLQRTNSLPLILR